jgi:hypothetical protein
MYFVYFMSKGVIVFQKNCMAFLSYEIIGFHPPSPPPPPSRLGVPHAGANTCVSLTGKQVNYFIFILIDRHNG